MTRRKRRKFPSTTTENGMKTGWIHWNEKDYFCDETGAMLVNTVTPDGASVGEDGARL